MSSSDILTFSRKKPFEPFRLLVSDDSMYDIRHPEFCMVLQTSVVVGVPGEPTSGIPESAEWLDARQIVKVIPLTPTASGGGSQSNGAPA